MKDWLIQLTKNKYYLIALTGYMVMQLLTLVVHSGLLFLVYEVLFISAIVIGIIWLIIDYKRNRNLRTFGLTIGLNFIINLILTIVYIPTLILNPQINWTLENGGGESDPMILLAFFPIVHFIGATIIFVICGLICKIFIKNE
jgi:hypothetical protein